MAWIGSSGPHVGCNYQPAVSHLSVSGDRCHFENVNMGLVSTTNTGLAQEEETYSSGSMLDRQWMGPAFDPHCRPGCTGADVGQLFHPVS